MNGKLSYRRDIEGLRGLAVCMVVAYHASPRRFHGGFIGVDVFFVLSGYLITGLLVREIEETGHLSLGGFYARRIRRLLPASSLVLLATILACAAFLSPMQQFNFADSGSHTALYVSNFWFLNKATDYFAGGIGNNPFLHTWSLAVEEQFYLVWPALILLGLRGRRPRLTLLNIIILVTLASLAASLWFTRTLQPWAFFSPLSRAWEFAIGGITLILTGKESQGSSVRGSSAFRTAAGWLGLVAILFSGAAVRGEGGWPSWQALIPVLGTAALLYGQVPGVGATRILEFPILQMLGRLSYSWYLWHWPVLMIAAAALPSLPLTQRLYVTLLCVFGSLGLAAVTHLLLENPIRISPYLLQRRALTLSAAGIVTIVSLGTALYWQRSASETVNALQGGQIMAVLKAPQETVSTCPKVGFLTTDVAECVSGNRASEFTLVLFGDSHAAQWQPAFDVISNDQGWRLVLIFKPSCPTAQVAIFNISLKRDYLECDVWREAAIKRIVEMRPGAVVITNRQLQNFTPGIQGLNETWREGTRKTLEIFDSAGLPTILLRDSPAPHTNIPNCLAGNTSWWSKTRARGNDPCMLDRAKALDEGVFRAEQEAARGLQNVSLLDLSDLFCDGPVCQPIKKDLIVYSDESHIGRQFSRSLAPAISVRLTSLVQSAER